MDKALTVFRLELKLEQYKIVISTLDDVERQLLVCQDPLRKFALQQERDYLTEKLCQLAADIKSLAEKL